MERLDSQARKRVIRKCSLLGKNPLRGSNIRRLGGYENLYRIRIGDWRVVYIVEGNVVIVKYIGHRKEIYRNI
ncbi:MAG: type II toxin-antitoxin system RelE/ParE family toxin [Chloroflexi bacterium]|nr:type II toxin-antitoxin system RelE/ParE family toxin [Chloroflexota bacterium]